MSDQADEQRRLILDQFTRQAIPFSQMPAHSNDAANRLLIDLASIGPADIVLDVACGPGLVACALAEVARHVTGIDLTPAMIDQAKARQEAMGLTNLTWLVGDAVPLPFPDAGFSVVVTRFSFHHFLDPKAVLAEMVRSGRHRADMALSAAEPPRHRPPMILHLAPMSVWAERCDGASRPFLAWPGHDIQFEAAQSEPHLEGYFL